MEMTGNGDFGLVWGTIIVGMYLIHPCISAMFELDQQHILSKLSWGMQS